MVLITVAMVRTKLIAKLMSVKLISSSALKTTLAFLSRTNVTVLRTAHVVQMRILSYVLTMRVQRCRQRFRRWIAVDFFNLPAATNPVSTSNSVVTAKKTARTGPTKQNLFAEHRPALLQQKQIASRVSFNAEMGRALKTGCAAMITMIAPTVQMN
jgi:hypothetical protein